MYKIMLVDDEPIILKGLTKLIEWEKIGLLTPLTMSSSKNALTEAKIYKPDIIITDIHMDEMDGISMIKQYNSISAENGAIVIVLSGYNEFQDAKEAIKINAFDYLSKPVSKEEIEQTLINAVKLLDKQREDLRLSEKLEQEFLESKNIRKEKTLRSLMFDVSQKIDSNKVEKDLEISKDYSFVILTLWHNAEINLFDIAVSLKKEVNGSFRFCTIINGDFCYIIVGGSSAQNLQKIEIERIYRVISSFCGEVTVGVSGIGSGFSSLRVLVGQAEYAFKRRFFQNKNCLIFFEKINFTNHSFSESEKSVLNLVSKSDVIKSEQKTLELLKMYQDFSETELDFKIKVAGFITELAHSVKIEADNSASLNQIINFKNIKSLTDWVKQQIHIFCGSERLLKLKEETNMMYRAENFIKKNYNKPITLEDVAATAFMTPTYFCAVFKKAYGTNFHNYLLKIRMEEGLKLLKTTGLKVYEVADMVGYKNARYFGEVFKKYYGFLATDTVAIQEI